MKGRKAKFRLSPNEEARLLQEEKERRRKLRLQQVRAQSKANAARIRKAVKDEENKLIGKLAAKVICEWEEEKDEKVKVLEDAYQRSVKGVGEGHQEAEDTDPEGRQELRLILQQEQQKAADQRGEEAVRLMQAQASQLQAEKNRLVVTRQLALEVEKLRAAEIAGLPPPKPDPLTLIDKNKNLSSIPVTDLNAFSTTHFHIPDVAVMKPSDIEQVDAKSAAQTEGQRYEEAEEEKRRVVTERQEKARLRHKHALHKELLKHDYDKMLHDLSDLQRADMVRRQKVVASIPKQVFLPPHRRMEEKEDQQRDMERAFEDMYMAGTDFMGDLSLALDPHPPPETPTVTETLELSALDDMTVGEDRAADDDPGHPAEVSDADKTRPALQDVTNRSQLIDRSKTPDSGLKKLLDRIRGQREEWVSRSNATYPEEDAKTEESSGTTTSSRPARTLTQYTITTDDVASRTDTQSLSTGEIDSSVPSPAHQASPQIPVEPAEDESSEEDTLEEGTITSGGQTSVDQGTDKGTLLHPMEQAAKIRNKVSGEDLNISAYLTEQRAKEEQQRQETERLKAETEARQRQIQEQKRALEERLKEIERKKKSYEMQMLNESQRSSTGPQAPPQQPLQPQPTNVQQNLPQMYQSQPLPQPVVNHQTERDLTQYMSQKHGLSQPLPSERFQPLNQERNSLESVEANGFQPGQIRQQPQPGQIGQQPFSNSFAESRVLHRPLAGQETMLQPQPLVSTQLLASTVPGKSNVATDHVKQYQQKLLSRQNKDRHEQLREARLELEKKTEELFRQANEDYLQPNHIQGNRFSELGHFHDVDTDKSPSEAGSGERYYAGRHSIQSHPSRQSFGSETQYMSFPADHIVQGSGGKRGSSVSQQGSERSRDSLPVQHVDRVHVPAPAPSAPPSAHKGSVSVSIASVPAEAPISSAPSQAAAPIPVRSELLRHPMESLSSTRKGEDQVSGYASIGGLSQQNTHSIATQNEASSGTVSGLASSAALHSPPTNTQSTTSTTKSSTITTQSDLLQPLSGMSLQEQLADIRRQKQEILDRQNRQRAELEALRSQWQESLASTEMHDVSQRVDQLRLESPYRGDSMTESDEPTPIDLLNPSYMSPKEREDLLRKEMSPKRTPPRGQSDLGGSFLQQGHQGQMHDQGQFDRRKPPVGYPMDEDDDYEPHELSTIQELETPKVDEEELRRYKEDTERKDNELAKRSLFAGSSDSGVPTTMRQDQVEYEDLEREEDKTLVEPRSMGVGDSNGDDQRLRGVGSEETKTGFYSSISEGPSISKSIDRKGRVEPVPGTSTEDFMSAYQPYAGGITLDSSAKRAPSQTVDIVQDASSQDRFKPSRNWQAEFAEYSISSSDDSRREGATQDVNDFRKKMQEESDELENKMRAVYEAVMKARSDSSSSHIDKPEVTNSSHFESQRLSSAESSIQPKASTKSKVPTTAMMSNLEAIENIFSIAQEEEFTSQQLSNRSSQQSEKTLPLYSLPNDLMRDDMSEYRRRSRSPVSKLDRNMPIDSSTPAKPVTHRSSLERSPMSKDAEPSPHTTHTPNGNSDVSLSQYPLSDKTSSLTQYPMSEKTGSASSLTQYPLGSTTLGKSSAYSENISPRSSDELANSGPSKSNNISQYPLSDISGGSSKNGRSLGASTDTSHFKIRPGSEADTIHSFKSGGPDASSPLFHSTFDHGKRRQEYNEDDSGRMIRKDQWHELKSEDISGIDRLSSGPPSEGQRSPPVVRFAAQTDVHQMSSRSSSEQHMASVGGQASPLPETVDGDELSRRVEASLQRHEQLLQKSQQTWGQPLQASMTEESGITEEPNLTLVSLGSTMSHTPMDTPSPAHRSRSADKSSSLLSFEQHEKSMLSTGEINSSVGSKHSVGKYSPLARQSFSPKERAQMSHFSPQSHVPAGSVTTQWVQLCPDSGLSESQRSESQDKSAERSPLSTRPQFTALDAETSEEQDINEGLTLADAFAKRRADFEASSRRRQEEAKKRAQEKTAKIAAANSSQQNQGHMSKTLTSWKQSRGLNSRNNSGGSSKSDLLQPGPSVTKTSDDRKKQTKEMKDRTSRLYGRSEEAQRKKEEEDRKKQYQANREKAREYEKKMQEKRKKKMDHKGHK